ncbi:unnamed protein product [Ostreobium quekettii]|uniref:Uncharacterized protein n=1 Tax=Ostreobium quekettii TaxID=121088 RepID=A0A8S1JAF9_9CHLO|nr:unnamed protein product [Ostreobium quekettii]|eukprot:evm.model.scf_450.5 EVM.evm.TU.scf_450.5   scf_450:59399-62702(+)
MSSKSWVDQKTSFLKQFGQKVANDKKKREELKAKRLARAREMQPATEHTPDVPMGEASNCGDDECLDQNIEPEVFAPIPQPAASGPTPVGPLGREFVDEVLGGDLDEDMGPSCSDHVGRELLVSGRLKLHYEITEQVPPQGVMSWLFDVVVHSTVDVDICAAYFMLKETWMPGCWAPSLGLLLQSLKYLGPKGLRNARLVLELIGIFYRVPHSDCSDWDVVTTAELLTAIFRLLLHPVAGSLEKEICVAAGALVGNRGKSPDAASQASLGSKVVASLLPLGTHRSQLKLLEFVDREGLGLGPPLLLRCQYSTLLLFKLMKEGGKEDNNDPAHIETGLVESVSPLFSAEAIIAACRGQDHQMNWWKMDTIVRSMELLLHEDVEGIQELAKTFQSEVVSKLIVFVLRQPRRCDNVGLAQVSLRVQGMDGM